MRFIPRISLPWNEMERIFAFLKHSSLRPLEEPQARRLVLRAEAIGRSDAARGTVPHQDDVHGGAAGVRFEVLKPAAP
jgi:hypothetical protein